MRAWVARLRTTFHETLRANLTPERIGLAVGVGVFIGCLPIYGLHVFVGIAVARWLELNQGLVFLSTNISNPLFAPFLVSAQIAVGELLRHGHIRPLHEVAPERTEWGWAVGGGDLVVSWIVGSLVVGGCVAVILGAVARFVAASRA
jgi:uncharacterized protein (DUF2062 family)